MFKWGNQVLPENLKGQKHNDWPWPFKQIPRAWTAFDLGPPKQILGNQKQMDARVDKKSCKIVPAPIGLPNSWQISRYPKAPKPFCWLPLYFAWSGKRGSDGKYPHFRIGARFDNIDSYAQFPSIAFRKYTGSDKQKT